MASKKAVIQKNLHGEKVEIKKDPILPPKGRPGKGMIFAHDLVILKAMETAKSSRDLIKVSSPNNIYNRLAYFETVGLVLRKRKGRYNNTTLSPKGKRLVAGYSAVLKEIKGIVF